MKKLPLTAAAAVAMFVVAAGAHANASPARGRGFVEMFVYSERGYAPTVPVKAGPTNISGYSLRVASEFRVTRIHRLLVFEDALLLLGNSAGSNEAKRNARPMTVLGQYGAGVDLWRGIEFRVTHGEGYDMGRPQTTGAPWNSMSVRFQRSASENYVELHFYPPHNEYDPYPFGGFAQRTVARYGLQFAERVSLPGYFRVFAFAEPLLLFGTTRPQISYTYSAKPLAGRLDLGAGFAIRPALQLRISVGEMRDLGGYRGPKQSWDALSLRYGW